MLRPRFHAMRIATTHVSSRHRLTGGLLASATLAFIVAFAKVMFPYYTSFPVLFGVVSELTHWLAAVE